MTDSFDLAIQSQFAEVKRQRSDMHPYQDGGDVSMVQFMLDNPFSAIFVDMGLGKTGSALTVISDYLSNFTIDEPVLVIGPIRVITDTWPTEITSWAHTAWMSHTILRVDDDDPQLLYAASAARQIARRQGCSTEEANKRAGQAMTAMRKMMLASLARTRSCIHFVNREAVEWLVYLHEDKWPYRKVFIDESSGVKDHKSKRFKALAKVRNTPGLIESLHIMTATPAAESYIGLWAQFYLLDRGLRLGKNITTFRNNYFSYNAYSRSYKLRPPDGEARLLEKIADITLVMKKKDYLPSAEPTIIRHMVTLEDAQIKMVKELEKNFILTLDDGKEIEAKTAAEMCSMLLQIASGFVYETELLGDWETEDLTKVKRVHHIHDHKIDALREIVEEAETQGQPLLVAYYFQSSLAKLRKAFPQGVVMDKEGKCIKKWSAGKIPLMFIHPQGDAHGLNLQYGGSTLIFYDLIYSLENFIQAIGRLDRQGQKWPVIVKLLIAKDTRDEFVADLIMAKEDAQAKFFRVLKRLIKAFKDAKRAQQETVEVDF